MRRKFRLNEIKAGLPHETQAQTFKAVFENFLTLDRPLERRNERERDFLPEALLK